MSSQIKTISGKERECQVIQDPIFIYIMKEYGEEKVPQGKEAIHLMQMVKNIHFTMRSPYGKLISLRKNSKRVEVQFLLYAIKDLEILPKIMGDEEYFRQTCFINTEFMKTWNQC